MQAMKNQPFDRRPGMPGAGAKYSSALKITPISSTAIRFHTQCRQKWQVTNSRVFTKVKKY